MRILIVLLSMAFMVSCGQKKSTGENTGEKTQTAEVREEVLHIGKMHCEMCAASIEKGLKSVEGVEFVKVSLADSTAIVKYVASETNHNELKKAVETRGYVLKDSELNP